LANQDITHTPCCGRNRNSSSDSNSDCDSDSDSDGRVWKASEWW